MLLSVLYYLLSIIRTRRNAMAANSMLFETVINMVLKGEKYDTIHFVPAIRYVCF